MYANTRLRTIILVLILFSGSCMRGLYYDQRSMNYATEIQQSALSLLDKAGENYSVHASAAESLIRKIDSARTYEMSRGEKINAPMIGMWNTVQSSQGNLVSLLELWKTQGTLSEAMLTESKTRISSLLNTIVTLENYKSKK